MGQARLNWWQRRIRERHGYLWEALPFISFVLAVAMTSADSKFIGDCLGREPMEGTGGRWAKLAQMLTGLACSPSLWNKGDYGRAMLLWITLSALLCAPIIVLEMQKFRYWKPRNDRANRIARERRAVKKLRQQASPTDRRDRAKAG